MDGNTFSNSVRRSEISLASDPHQKWLQVSREDEQGNRQAFLMARKELPESVIIQALQLRDSAQHHFISMLRFTKNGDILSPEEALASAVEHQEQLP